MSRWDAVLDRLVLGDPDEEQIDPAALEEDLVVVLLRVRVELPAGGVAPEGRQLVRLGAVEGHTVNVNHEPTQPDTTKAVKLVSGEPFQDPRITPPDAPVRPAETPGRAVSGRLRRG
ncbi:hypothetical protein GCM10018952_49750 [Streptosporangium vulgare]